MKNIITSAHLPKPGQKQSVKEGDIFYIPEYNDYIMYVMIEASEFKFVSLSEGNRYGIKSKEDLFQKYPYAKKLEKGESITITAN